MENNGLFQNGSNSKIKQAIKQKIVPKISLISFEKFARCHINNEENDDDELLRSGRSSMVQVIKDQTIYDKEFYSKQIVMVSNVNIYRCSFYRCKSFGYSFDLDEGGALLLRGTITNITETNFRYNYASQIGGAVRISSSANSVFRFCIFGDNTALKWSGAVSLFNVFESTMSNCQFINNQCQNNVSALMYTLCQNIIFQNNIFYNNQAKKYGALWIEKSKIQANNISFYSNKAEISTALTVVKNSASFFENSVFSDSKMHLAIYADNSTLTINSTSFSNLLSIDKNSTKIISNNCTQEEIKDAIIYLPSVPMKQNTSIFSLNFQKASISPKNTVSPSQTMPINKDSVISKSKLMMIAYVIAIILLIIAIKINFGEDISHSTAINNGSIFGDDLMNDELEKYSTVKLESPADL